jgi:hypothetical protein
MIQHKTFQVSREKFDKESIGPSVDANDNIYPAPSCNAQQTAANYKLDQQLVHGTQSAQLNVGKRTLMMTIILPDGLAGCHLPQTSSMIGGSSRNILAFGPNSVEGTYLLPNTLSLR